MEHENRLQLKPYRSASEHIDGAWWPHSRHLIDELPDVVAAVSDRLGRVVMVGYHRNGWDESPPLTEIADCTIELLGFTGGAPASVIVIGEDGRYLSLQVIAPDTSEEVARHLLDDAAVPADVAPASSSAAARSAADVADRLASHEGSDEQRTAEIKRWCEESAQQFVDAPVQSFVPILVEHIVRSRMIETRRQQHQPPATESLTA